MPNKPQSPVTPASVERLHLGAASARGKGAGASSTIFTAGFDGPLCFDASVSSASDWINGMCMCHEADVE